MPEPADSLIALADELDRLASQRPVHDEAVSTWRAAAELARSRAHAAAEAPSEPVPVSPDAGEPSGDPGATEAVVRAVMDAEAEYARSRHRIRGGYWVMPPKHQVTRLIATAERLIRADERAPHEVTLATLRETAVRAASSPPGNDHGRGYRRAMKDVLAVLDAHGSPPGTPVHFGAGDE